MMYQSTDLKNGVRVLTVPMPNRDSVSVGVWVRVGGRFEPAKISGASHYIEHLVFKGTENYSMYAIKENIEGKGGMLNAFTSEETTCYYTKTLSQHLPLAFDVLSELVARPLLRLEDMEKERTVILEEIKMYYDIPSSYVQELIAELLWEDQALGRNVAGTAQTVTAMTLNDLKGFHSAFYHPVNILVTAAGKVDHADLVNRAEEKFKGLPIAKTSEYFKADSTQKTPKFRFLEKDTEQCHWVLGLHGLSKTHPDRYKLGLLHVILGANMSSRLFNEIREKRGLAYSIHSSVSTFLDTGSFTVSAGVDPNKASLALQVTLKELKKIAAKGITQDELRRAKDYFLGQLFLMLEDTLDHMVWAGDRFLYYGACLKREDVIAEVEKITEADIQQMAQQTFMTEHLNLALIGPVKEKAQKEIRDFFSFENC
jgi:predicted Zn-dependent peptidase